MGAPLFIPEKLLFHNNGKICKKADNYIGIVYEIDWEIIDKKLKENWEKNQRNSPLFSIIFFLI